MSKVKISLVGGLVAGMAMVSTIGAAAQDAAPDPMAPALVTGEVWFAPSCRSATITKLDGVTQERGYRCAPQQWKSDDPRLGGDTTATWNADVYVPDEEQAFEKYSVIAGTWDVRGEAGGWLCTNVNGLDLGSGLFTSSMQGSDRLTCNGDGDNEGLSAVLIADWSGNPKTFEGLIFPGPVTPLPDPSAE